MELDQMRASGTATQDIFSFQNAGTSFEDMQVFSYEILLIFSAVSMGIKSQVFAWVFTVLPSMTICFGTLQRVIQINRVEWSSGVSIPALQSYFTQSLQSWIACIIMDGLHAFKIIGAHRGTLRESLCRALRGPSAIQVAEAVGLSSCFLSMLILAVDVYQNFQQFTENLVVYLLFLLAVGAKLARIIVQGLVVLATPQQLVQRQHKVLTLQLGFSSLFLIIQVLLLSLFAPENWFSALLLAGNVLYRVLQYIKIGYHWWHKDHRIQQDTSYDLIQVVLFALGTIFVRPSDQLGFTPNTFIEDTKMKEKLTAKVSPGVSPEELPHPQKESERERENEPGWSLKLFLSQFGP